MSKVKEALAEHEARKSNSINMVRNLLNEVSKEIEANPESLLSIIRTNGGECWVYKYYKLSKELLDAIAINEKMRVPLNVEGFEGCVVRLCSSGVQAYAVVEYSERVL